MRTSIVLTFLYLLTLPGGAAAQTWREAYNLGDVEKAAHLEAPPIASKPN